MSSFKDYGLQAEILDAITSLGYVDPTDAAHQILHEAIEPIIAEMDRHLELGFGQQALETCKGLILGLYETRDTSLAFMRRSR